MDKKSIAVMPVWLGTRFLDDSDYSAFDRALYMIRRFDLAQPIKFSNADKMEGAHPYMGRMELDIKMIFNHVVEPLAIFFIVTPRVAERVWLDTFMQNLKRYRSEHQKREIFGYKIIMGGSGFSKSIRYADKNNYWDDERISLELGGIYSYMNSDAPSNGCERLVSLMNRIMGMDLPGEEFPDYSLEELGKIAWNINRENFNYCGVREGSIPKYPIVNGRPQFSF